jgi:hypothetical protein
MRKEARMLNCQKSGAEKSEIIAFAFGVLLILVTFGDGHIYWFVGNLDTIFGLVFWRALDTFYPLASIVIFLLYGWVKVDRLKINSVTVLLFASFVAVLALIYIDDIVQLMKLNMLPQRLYWTVITWAYPFYSSIAFFLFGRKHETVSTILQLFDHSI